MRSTSEDFLLLLQFFTLAIIIKIANFQEVEKSQSIAIMSLRFAKIKPVGYHFNAMTLTSRREALIKTIHKKVQS